MLPRNLTIIHTYIYPGPQQIYFFRGNEVLVTGLDGQLQQRVPVRQLFPGAPERVKAAFYNRQLNHMMLYDWNFVRLFGTTVIYTHF